MTRRRGWLAAALAAGTVGAVGAAQGYGSRAFARRIDRDVRELLAATPTDIRPRLVTEPMLAELPEPVSRYLRYTGVVGTPMVRTAHLRQRGRMLLAPGQPWIPLTAQQWYTTDPPGFVWDGTLRVASLPVVRARDTYRDGHGAMLIKAASLVTVQDATGAEMDHSSLVRYLSEVMWFPAAFLGANITFQPVDQTSAQVTVTDRGRKVTATLLFDRQGRLTEFLGQRHATLDGPLQSWSVPITAYGDLAGLRLPVRAAAVYHFPERDLEYIDVTITALQHG